LIKSSANSTVVFDRHGLGTTGFWGAGRIPIGEGGSNGLASGLRDALEQLGGLYAAFGRFLCWRADLLGASYLSKLRDIALNPPVVPPSAVAAAIRKEPCEGAEELISGLDQTPVWNTLTRTAYRSSYRGVPVVVEVARDPVSAESFAEFEKTMRSLRRPELENIVAPAVLAQFQEWIRLGESLTRERSFLKVLAQDRGETLVEYPNLIPEISTSSVLCWPVPEGRPVTELIERGDPRGPVLIASAILEQFYTLSMVDGDLDPGAMIVDAKGRLHVLRLNNPIAVLPSLINTGIKYTAAVVAGDAALSAQTLIRLILSQPPLDLEKSLMDEFSGIEPELKVHMWFPATAGAFESNWRALARLAPVRPLFLDCLHRNLVAVGYWNSDSVRAGAPTVDAIADAQWPVVGSLLRTQFGLLMNRESAKEWAFGSGLLMFGTMREISRLAEEVRENDITVGVDLEDRRPPKDSGGRSSYLAILGALLLVLLASLRWGIEAPGAWSVVLKTVAVGVLPAMFWVLSRIG
jgi:hypothetical protein